VISSDRQKVNNAKSAAKVVARGRLTVPIQTGKWIARNACCPPADKGHLS
jgi:hypothetical protein